MAFDIADLLRDKTADDGTKTFDELRGMTPDDMQGFVEVLDAHLRSIHIDENTGELRDKTPAEQTAFTYGLKLRDAAIDKLNDHRAVQEVFKRRPKAVEAAMFNLGNNRSKDDPYGDIRRMSVAEARDRALRVLDDRNSAGHLGSDQQDQVERSIRTSTDIARRILVTENDGYRDAWLKIMTQPHAGMFLEDDERAALRSWNDYRAASEGTTTAGGFGIPVELAA